jgi:predicted RNA-binding Zn ribbon-like protein
MWQTSVDVHGGLRQYVVMDRFDPGRQPAGRRPAPGRLGYVQAFLNSFWDLDNDGVDRWATSDGLAAWLRERGFDGPVTEPERARTVALRDGLRDALRGNGWDRVRDDGLLVVRHDARGGWLEAAGEGPAAARALALGVVLEARRDGSWERMKACPGPHCGWAFHDHSRNRSGQWCSMRICGNRTKGATFRQRRRAAGPLSPQG